MPGAISTEPFQSNKIYLNALLDIVNDFMDLYYYLKKPAQLFL